MSENLDPEASEDTGTDKIRLDVRGFIVREYLPREESAALVDSTPLITGGILDSIGSVKLVSYLEERYGIRFESHEVSIDNLDTLDRIVATVRDKLER